LNEDLVYISPVGAFATTAPCFTSWGYPCKHIMSVIVNGGGFLNPVVHMHKMYLKEYIPDLSTEMKEALNASKDKLTVVQTDRLIVCSVTECEWDCCTRDTASQWEAISMGTTAVATNTTTTTSFAVLGKGTDGNDDDEHTATSCRIIEMHHAKSSIPTLSKRDELRKLAYSLVERSLKDADVERALHVFYQKVEAHVATVSGYDHNATLSIMRTDGAGSKKKRKPKASVAFVPDNNSAGDLTTDCFVETVTTSAAVNYSSKRLKSGSEKNSKAKAKAKAK
jgi:hypothetical protein